MKNYSLKIKNILILPLVVVVIFFSLNTPRAHAQGIVVPTWDALDIFEQITQSLVRAAADMALQAGRISVDSAAYAAGQLLLNQVTDNTITWIRGGFNGSPSFDVNPEKLLLGLADGVAGNTARQIRGLTNTSFSSTFINDLSNSVELSTRNDASAKFAAQLRNPFPSTINPSSFYTPGANTFQQNGGWKAFEAALEDSGNGFGTRVLVGEELAVRQETAQKIQETKLARSNGFMDIVDTGNCAYPEGQEAFDAIDWEYDPGGKANWQKMYCATKTPGKVVGDQLTKALGVDMDRLGFVDNINKILGAVIRELTSSAVKSLF